jgi:hypothetical protein
MKYLAIIASTALASCQPAYADVYGPPAPVEAAPASLPDEFELGETESLSEAAARYQRARRSALRWQWTRQTLSFVDTAQTVYHCNRVARHRKCEANPIFGSHPSTGRIVATKLGMDALQWFLFRRTLERDPDAARRMSIIGVVIQGGIVGMNFKTIF